MTRDEADAILSGSGWLPGRGAPFREEVLRRSVLLQFGAGACIYRMGDPPGGIYGLVRGSVTVNCAPPEAAPKVVQMGLAGVWTGEGTYLSREPRRVELRTSAESWMMHLPLDQMDKMTFRDPGVIRDFSMIMVHANDILIRVVHDLQKQDPARRIAATIHRATFGHQSRLPLRQAELGEMACASRRQVGSVLKDFSDRGWIETGYGSIVVLDAPALYQYAHAC